MKKTILILLSIIFITIVLIYVNDYVNNSYGIENIDGIIKHKDNAIEVNYSDLDELFTEINDYIYFNDTIDYIYKDIIDKYFEMQRLKMFKKDNKTYLEIKLTEEDSKKYFNKENEETIRIVFNNNESFDNIDIESLYYEINKETIIRNKIVETAKKEIGKTGETYWKWYGFNHRVEWCCVFVSWVFNENGLLNEKIPKFIWVKKGVDYFKVRNQLKFRNEYTPREGDIIFYDWNNNGVIDHVGIVEKVTGGYVYAIEGNVGKVNVARRKSKLNSYYIYAYGVPKY